MTLDEACADLNAIALRFAEFAMADEDSAREWHALALSCPLSTREICQQNAKRYAARKESRERESRSILFVLLKLSELQGEKDHGRRRNEPQAEAAGATAG